MVNIVEKAIQGQILDVPQTVDHQPNQKICQPIDKIHQVPHHFLKRSTAMEKQFNHKHGTLQHVFFQVKSLQVNPHQFYKSIPQMERC